MWVAGEMNSFQCELMDLWNVTLRKWIHGIGLRKKKKKDWESLTKILICNTVEVSSMGIELHL